MHAYRKHKDEFDKSLRELVDAGGTKRFNPTSEFVKIGHLRHLATLGFVIELHQEFSVTFRITDEGRRALEETEN